MQEIKVFMHNYSAVLAKNAGKTGVSAWRNASFCNFLMKEVAKIFLSNLTKT